MARGAWQAALHVISCELEVQYREVVFMVLTGQSILEKCKHMIEILCLHSILETLSLGQMAP